MISDSFYEVFNSDIRLLAHAVEDTALPEQVFWGIVFHGSSLVHHKNFVI